MDINASNSSNGNSYSSSINNNNNNNNNNNEEDDYINNLQKKIRELNLALEQCQRGTSVPSIILTVPLSIIEASRLTEANIVRNHLDKYNPTQVDQFLKDISLFDSITRYNDINDDIYIHYMLTSSCLY